jgi:uncharacterized membrane protein
VIFAMLSNHYSFTWSHPQNWLVLILMMFAGAAIRQFFVLRHGYKLGRNKHPLPYALVGVAVLVGVIAWLKPAPQVGASATASGAAPATPVTYAQIKPVLSQHCVQCHGEQVQMKNVRVDSPEQVQRHAQAIYQQVVVSKLMPMNNATGITEEERSLIGRWFMAGAKIN